MSITDRFLSAIAKPRHKYQVGLRGLYPDEETYTRQLRKLEEYVRKHPESGYGHFVLAYQYLVLDAMDAALKQLREVVRLQPEDKLSAALLDALTTPAPAK